MRHTKIFHQEKYKFQHHPFSRKIPQEKQEYPGSVKVFHRYTDKQLHFRPFRAADRETFYFEKKRYDAVRFPFQIL